MELETAEGKLDPEVVDITTEKLMEKPAVIAPIANKPKVYLALPTYDERSMTAQMFPILTSSNDGVVTIMSFGFSILTYTFNWLWADALNARRTRGITHFAMLHSDIIPQGGWLKVMLEEMITHDADIMSAVVPIKDSTGLTSTGLSLHPNKPSLIRRLTMAEIMEKPETFTDDFLVINSGLMVIDMRKPWVEKIHFHIKNAIDKMPDGAFVARVESEDWNFSRRARDLGAKVFATRKIKLQHAGTQKYPNDQVWGTAKTDPVWQNIVTSAMVEPVEVISDEK